MWIFLFDVYNLVNVEVYFLFGKPRRLIIRVSKPEITLKNCMEKSFIIKWVQ